MMAEDIDVGAFTRFEREGWERIPDAYHRFFGPITGEFVEPLLDAAGVGGGSHVLDVGTGPGYLAGRAAARGAAVVGVDLSSAILTLAAEFAPDVTFRQGDALDLPFEAGSFDAVVCGFLIPHLAEHDRPLAESHRVLAPGGTVALSTWGASEEVPMLGVVARAVAEVGA
jgi:ubiquinone/menaquinone biosynthesis C-methylase UbiE